MSTISHIAFSTDRRLAKSPRRVGSLILTYCIALPLFGRAVFPMVRDKAHITLASSFSDPQIVATFLAAAVMTLRLFTAGNLFGQMHRGHLVRMLVLFVAACLASSFGSLFPLFSMWRCFEVALLTLWAFLMIRDSSGAGEPSRAIQAFYGISVAILIGVFVDLVINPSGVWDMEGDVARLTGGTGYSIGPNEIGAIAAVMAVGCYVRAVERRSLKYAVAAALFIIVCYLSHSRASYIALAAGSAGANVMLGRLAHRRAIILGMSFCVALVAGVLALISPEVRDFFVSLMTRGHETQNLESFGGRLQVWEFGLQIFTQHPYLGTGYGTYPKGLEGGHFHNVFIELLVTTGIVGAVSFAAFLVTLISTTRRSIRGTNREVVAERIIAADLVTIPAVIIVANNATAGSAYYSWDLLGLVSVAVASSLLLVRRHVAGKQHVERVPFRHLMR